MVLEVVCAILKEKMEEFIHVIQLKVRVLSLLLHHFLYIKRLFCFQCNCFESSNALGLHLTEMRELFSKYYVHACGGQLGLGTNVDSEQTRFICNNCLGF